MLNISSNRVEHLIDLKKYKSPLAIYASKLPRQSLRWFMLLFGLCILISFLPWTQNVQADGFVTNLRPDQRPQTINSVIAGQIERWYVQEGQFVKKGDTILFISEVKDEYFDPNLLMRTKERLAAQEGGIAAYIKKISAVDQQVGALKESQILKKQQAQNILKSRRNNISDKKVCMSKA